MRGEIGLHPLSIEIYKNMIRQFFYLIDFEEGGNQITFCVVSECITLECWLKSILYLFSITLMQGSCSQFQTLIFYLQL